MNVELRDLIEQLRHYVQGITRDEDTANEVVQNALFKALSRGKLFPQHRGWLFTVAKHEAYKTLKRAPYAMPEAPLEAPANYHENSIVEYMHLLKNEERNLIYMRYFNQFSIKELSALFHRPEGTIKRKLHNARESLKKEFIMSEKMAAPEITITHCKDQSPGNIRIAGQGLLMGNPGFGPGDCELIHYYEYPDRVFCYSSETEVTRRMQLAGSEVVEVVNRYQKREGETERRMYYQVTDDQLKMVMRIFVWDKDGIKVQTDEAELVRPSNRTLTIGSTITESRKVVIDRVDVTIDNQEYPGCFRKRSSCDDYHGKECNESIYSAEGREILHRGYIGNNWRMGGYVSWEKMENSQEIQFHGESYRLWVETVIIKSYKKELLPTDGDGF